MFKNKLFFYLCAALLCAVAYARPDQPEGTPIPIADASSLEYSIPPKAPALVPVGCVYYSADATIAVDFQDNLGYVSVEIENLTTGEYTQTMVNSADGSAIFPISGNAGFWTITFSLSDGTVYYGEFNL